MTAESIASGMLQTAEAAWFLVGFLFCWWVVGEIVSGKASRKWRKIKRHEVRR